MKTQSKALRFRYLRMGIILIVEAGGGRMIVEQICSDFLYLCRCLTSTLVTPNVEEIGFSDL